jgi:hypothetical protein
MAGEGGTVRVPPAKKARKSQAHSAEVDSPVPDKTAKKRKKAADPSEPTAADTALFGRVQVRLLLWGGTNKKKTILKMHANTQVLDAGSRMQ